MEQVAETCKRFLSYSGIRLPLKLVNPLDSDEIDNRNTFYRGYFDRHERLLRLEKVVYGEVELEHRYCYYADGLLKQAEITMDDETNVIKYDEQGQPT